MGQISLSSLLNGCVARDFVGHLPQFINSLTHIFREALQFLVIHFARSALWPTYYFLQMKSQQISKVFSK